MANRYVDAGDESPVASARANDLARGVAARGESAGASSPSGGTTTDVGPRARKSRATSPIDAIWQPEDLVSRRKLVVPKELSTSMRALSDIGNAGAAAPARKAEAPNEIDVESYLLGQKHALESAFDKSLPQRQLLGALQLALHDVREKTSFLESANADIEGAVRRSEGVQIQVTNDVRALTTSTIPAIERAIGELRARMDVEERRKTMSLTSLVRETAMRTLFGVATLETAVGNFTRSVLFSQTDQSDASTARKVDATPVYAQTLGAVFLVTTLELAARTNEYIRSRAPPSVQRTTATFAWGLNACRTLLWAAAAVECLQFTKERCHALASIAYAAATSSRAAATPDEVEAANTSEDESDV
jgi:hypothetical protein